MAILGGIDLLATIEECRIVWINGKLRSGKTLAAFALGYELVKKMNYRYIVSNVPSVWNEDLRQVYKRDRYNLDAVVIYDEGGRFIKGSYMAEYYSQFAGKLNMVLFCPSRAEPNQNFYEMVIKRWINAEIYGLPFWVYQYWYRGDPKPIGSFIIWRPSSYFGVYSTKLAALDDQSLGRWMDDQVKEIKATSVNSYRSLPQVQNTFVDAIQPGNCEQQEEDW